MCKTMYTKRLRKISPKIKIELQNCWSYYIKLKVERGSKMKELYKNTTDNQRKILEALEVVHAQMIRFNDNFEILKELYRIEKELLKGWE